MVSPACLLAFCLYINYMEKNRLEAFSDGVIAIIITIMVLEMKVPHATTLEQMRPLMPVLLSYIISFVYVGIYWNNHHHMLQAITKVNGKVLWANLHLLFWLSLIPFASGWMGENHFAAEPVALYGFVLTMSAFAYFILSRCLISLHGNSSRLALAVGNDFKGKISLVIYFMGIIIAYFEPWAAIILYISVAMIWLVPDRRIEKTAHNLYY